MSAYLHGTDVLGATVRAAPRPAARVPQVRRAPSPPAQVSRPAAAPRAVARQIQVAVPATPHLERSLAHAAASRPALPRLSQAPKLDARALQAAKQAVSRGASAAAHAASTARKLSKKRPDLAGKLQALSQRATQKASEAQKVQATQVVGDGNIYMMAVAIDPAAIARFVAYFQQVEAAAQAGDIANRILTVAQPLAQDSPLLTPAQALLDRCTSVIDGVNSASGDPGAAGEVAAIQHDEQAWEAQVNAGSSAPPPADAGAGAAGGGDDGGAGGEGAADDSNVDWGDGSAPPDGTDTSNDGVDQGGVPSDGGGPTLAPRSLKVRHLKTPSEKTDTPAKPKKSTWQQVREGWGWGVGALGVVGVFAAVRHFGK